MFTGCLRRFAAHRLQHHFVDGASPATNGKGHGRNSQQWHSCAWLSCTASVKCPGFLEVTACSTRAQMGPVLQQADSLQPPPAQGRWSEDSTGRSSGSSCCGCCCGAGLKQPLDQEHALLKEQCAKKACDAAAGVTQGHLTASRGCGPVQLHCRQARSCNYSPHYENSNKKLAESWGS